MVILIDNVVKSVRILGGSYLIGISGADRRHDISAHDSALHKIKASVILKDIKRIITEGKHVTENRGAVIALIFNIVNGKHGSYVLVSLSPSEKAVEVHHAQSRLPVMGVQNVGIKSYSFEHFKHCHTEKCIALTVVKLSVKSLACEIILVIYEIVGNAVLNKAFHATVSPTPSQPYLKAGNRFHLRFPLVLDRAVKRHNHANVTILISRFYSRGQGAHYVAKSSCRRKRHGLRADK